MKNVRKGMCSIPANQATAKRTSAIAAMVPSNTAALEAVTATSSDSNAACSNWRLCNSSRYQAVENPPQTFTSGDALKE